LLVENEKGRSDTIALALSTAIYLLVFVDTSKSR
jgi:hypothetical protein